jgi:hypothetical protein
LFPGTSAFSRNIETQAGLVIMVVTLSRDDSILQARRLISEVSVPSPLILSMSRSLADLTETGISAVLPYNETLAQSSASRLTDPFLVLAYLDWKSKGK